MRKTIATVLLVLGTVVPTMAHHPFASEYDWKKPATLMGTISKVEWMAPHVHLMVDGKIDSKDKSNSAATWTIEMGSPNQLTQLGWKLAALKAGDRVTVDGWLGYTDSNHMMNAKSVQFSDGRVLSAGSSFFDIEPLANVTSTDGPHGLTTERVASPASSSIR